MKKGKQPAPDAPETARESAAADSGSTDPQEGASGLALGRKTPPAVVGIGASAGGLDAFVRLVGHLEPDTGLAYVLVQHLDPLQESLLPAILGRASPVPVVAATDGLLIEADQAYVIPPGASLTLTDGHLRVLHRNRTPGVHTVIDSFLKSLADVRGSDAIAVILSGAGSDGSRGVESIKEGGGITIAQDTSTAQFPSMPQSAIDTGCIDFVLPPEEIAAQLTRIGRFPAARGVASSVDEKDQQSVPKILHLLRERTGVDFQHYRRATVDRRIMRRMLVHRQENHGEYLATVRANPTELDLLAEDLLIGVTRFFRDPEAFAALKEHAFPRIMKGVSAGVPIRAWVAGCSDGAEAYSLAMLLLEYVGETSMDTDVQIFATDLNDAAVARARAGIYPHRIEEDVSPERLNRFFVGEDRGYRVARAVRDLCVFAKHDLVRDPPFSQLDLITCRNVLIYFDTPLQERAMRVFHYGLSPTGVLMLGSAESAAPQYFSPIDKAHKLYQPQPGAHRSLDLETNAQLNSAVVGRNSRADQSVQPSTPQTIQQYADRAVLSRFAPAGVVINDSLDILQFRGDTTGFLVHPPGVATTHLLKVVRPEFLPRLRNAIDRASKEASVAREDNIALRDGDSIRRVSLEIIPFRAPPNRDRLFVILFDTTAEQDDHPATRRRRKRAPVDASANPDGEPGTAADMTQLRDDLNNAKAYLQDVIEQYEAANEELRAASEELQSSNEELQSTNEELETTKEEVQSTNEELTTVNEELRHRNRELAAISSDLANVFASTQVPILMVDSNLAIRRFTPVVQRVIKLIAGDIGRPLGDIKLRVQVPDLEARVAASIESLELSQIDVLDDAGNWWSLTIRPYVTVDRKVDGAVLVFTDIDAAKKYGEQSDETSEARRKLLIDAEEARAEASAANMTKMAFLANMSHDLRTPLNAISGYTEILELGIHGSLTPRQDKDIASIKRSARHLLSLINDILNFAKIGTGEIDLRIEPLPLPAVLATLEEIVFPQMRAKGLSFELHGCDTKVLADHDKLQQVLLNIVSNAIKFTPSGSVSVRCSTDASTVRIRVADTGVGIPAGQLERIFEPFIQVARSLTNVKHDGVGLGLSISRDLARAMGGDVSAESSFGVGSTFTVTLPRSRV